jgi:hypothetical protein
VMEPLGHTKTLLFYSFEWLSRKSISVVFPSGFKSWDAGAGGIVDTSRNPVGRMLPIACRTGNNLLEQAYATQSSQIGHDKSGEWSRPYPPKALRAARPAGLTGITQVDLSCRGNLIPGKKYQVRSLLIVLTRQS